MGTRLPPEAVLRQEARRRILLAVEREPGVTFTDLRRALGLSAGGLTHHAGVLERHRLVVSRHEGRARVFYPRARVPPAAGQRLGATAQRVLQAARRRHGAALADLPALAGVGKSTVSYHVARLREKGLVTVVQRPDGRRVVHAVRADFQHAHDHPPTNGHPVAS